MSQAYQRVATEEVGSIPAKSRPFFKRPEVIFLFTVFLSFLLFAVAALALFYLGAAAIVLLPVAASLFEYLSMGCFGAVVLSGFLLLLGYFSHHQKAKIEPPLGPSQKTPPGFSSPPPPPQFTSEFISEVSVCSPVSPSLLELGDNLPPRIRAASLMLRSTKGIIVLGPVKPAAEKSRSCSLGNAETPSAFSTPRSLQQSADVSPNSPSAFGSSSGVWRINRPKLPTVLEPSAEERESLIIPSALP